MPPKNDNPPPLPLPPDWNDNPESTDEDLARARPMAEVFPDPVAANTPPRRRGRPPAEHPKVAIKLRLDDDVVKAFRATGPGWQSRINATLRQHLPKR